MRLSFQLATLVTFGVTGLLLGEERITKAPMKEPDPKLSEKEEAEWDKAKAILAKSNVIELYSLEPIRDEKGKDNFHGWKVLGKTTVKEEAARKSLLAVTGTIGPGYGAKCFEPRHGIRVTSGDTHIDLIICFECSWVYIYFKGKGDDRLRLIIGRDQQPALDRILTEAKVPLPKQSKE
ncbi:MAG: hypothetical protein EXS09_16870 [Gemmataceae bacterium]|nr:hypothetical protein [Gemmataceae bacterium]